MTGYYGLLRRPDGLEFFSHNESLDELLEELKNKQFILVGVIDLSTSEVVHLGESYLGRKEQARQELLESINQNKT